MLFALIWIPQKGTLSVFALEGLTRTLDYFNYNEGGAWESAAFQDKGSKNKGLMTYQ